MEENYGAQIERGTVTEKTAAGYRVKSLSRPGITTPVLPAAQGMEADVGDNVCFFMFEDGTGAILTKIAE
ncbi:MAG: hypothetical protein LLF96_13210 [Eubacteriales bacterium]|nr:hypothetical protein [Eubacteriales bacterium]